MAQARFFSFHLTASTDERIPLLQYTGTLRNEGVPHASGFTRGGLSYAKRFEAILWTGPSAFPHVQLLSAAAAAQHDGGWPRFTFFLSS